MKRFGAFVMCVLFLWCVTGCAGQTQAKKQEAFLFDTLVSITYYDEKDASLVEEAMRMMQTYERIFSKTDTQSELYQLNCSGDAVVSEDLFLLVTLAKDYSALSGGAFDPTVYPLCALWDYKAQTVPSSQQIRAALQFVDYTSVRLDENTRRIRLENGVKLDLGAVCKGYVAQKIKTYLAQNGVDSAVLDLGGNVALIGRRPDDARFIVGVRDPFQTDTLFATLALEDCYAVTAGVYERAFTAPDGTLCHHIIDPFTGYPAQSGVVSATIIGDDGALCDFLSTACILLGQQRGSVLCEQMGCAYLLILDDGSTVMSEGFEAAYDFRAQ